MQKQSDRYFKYERSDWNKVTAEERAPGTESAGGGFDVDNTPNYFCRVYAVHKDIDDQIRSNADEPLDMDRDATMWVTHQLLLKREKLWATKFFATGIWGVEYSGVSGSPGAGEFKQWDQADSTPIEDVTDRSIEIAEDTGYKPNVLVLSPYVFNTLKNNADILDRIKYTQRGVVTTDILAGLFDVERVLVPFGIENTAAEGATEISSFVFGKHALLVYANPQPSIMQPSGGYTFSWNGFLGAGRQGNRIKRFRMEHLSADRVEGELAIDPKVVGSDLGAFFKDSVA